MTESALRTTYDALVTTSGGSYVVPGRAGASPLIQVLLGRNADTLTVDTPAHDLLDRRELTLFIEWVDLGAVWASPPSPDRSAK
jgi:hypothetical protein